MINRGSFRYTLTSWQHCSFYRAACIVLFIEAPLLQCHMQNRMTAIVCFSHLLLTSDTDCRERCTTRLSSLLQYRPTDRPHPHRFKITISDNNFGIQEYGSWSNQQKCLLFLSLKNILISSTFRNVESQNIKKIVVAKRYLLLWGNKVHDGFKNIFFRNIYWSKELKKPGNLYYTTKNLLIYLGYQMPLAYGNVRVYEGNIANLRILMGRLLRNHRIGGPSKGEKNNI